MTEPSAYRYETAPLPEAEGGGYVVSFPDIPGCLGVADTEEEAIADAQKALFACLDALKAVGRTAPAPSAQPG
jgi:predicted RNase H-like HicB family nuclease